MHDEADRDQVLAEMIEEGTAAGSVLERPTHRVLDEAGLVLGGRNLPKLFQADAIFLRAALRVQAKLPDQLLGEGAARAFGKERVFAAKRDARRVAVLVRAVLGHAHVAGDDTLDGAVLADDGFGDGDTGIDFHAQGFGLLAEPAAERAEAAGVAAVIVHQRRHEDIGDADAAGLPEIIEAILGDLQW